MFVLVHGAGGGATSWDRLLPHLDRPAIAVDLPGRGSRADVDLASVRLDDCARAILDDVAAADGADTDDLVLVGHSFAGVSVPRVMAELAPRLRHVVFLSAVVPPDGTAVLDQIDPAVRELVRAAIDGGIYSQDRESARVMLCNDMPDDPGPLLPATPAGALGPDRRWRHRVPGVGPHGHGVDPRAGGGPAEPAPPLSRIGPCGPV